MMEKLDDHDTDEEPKPVNIVMFYGPGGTAHWIDLNNPNASDHEEVFGELANKCVDAIAWLGSLVRKLTQR